MVTLDQTRQSFVENLSRISQFWGYPRAMGALYGALYLSPGPLSLDDLIPIVGVTKGAISTNIRALEQLGMVHKHVRSGDRKDYYAADTDFWKITKTILERRQKPEFDKALNDVSLALQNIRSRSRSGSEAELARFYEERLSAMETFFHTVDNVVALLLQIERLRVDGLRSLLRVVSKPKTRMRTP
jgi:DNA-binding transcriptional regulator GbsR (MarR family)